MLTKRLSFVLCLDIFSWSLVHTAHFFVSARFPGSSPDCQCNTVIVTTLKFANLFRHVVSVPVDLSSNDERTHPRRRKETSSRARRVCHWPRVESKILLSLGGCEPREAELARRGHRDLSLSFLFCDFSSASFLVYTSLWRSTRGSRYLEKPRRRVLGKIWERPGTTFLVSSWRSPVRINDLSQRF